MPEDQEFGRNRAEVDRPADQRLRRILERHFDLSRRRSSEDAPRRARRRGRSASSTSFSIGSSVTTQVWPTVADTRPTTRRPPRPCRVTSKLASRRGKAASPASVGDRRARLRIGNEIEMPSGLGHVADRERHAPGTCGTRSRACTCLLGIDCVLVRHARNSTCSGSGKASCARSNPSCAASPRTASRT